MNGLAADVEGGHAGRGQDDDLLVRVISEVIKQGRFPCAGTPGDEDRLVGIFQKVQGPLKFRGEFQGGFLRDFLAAAHFLYFYHKNGPGCISKSNPNQKSMDFY